MVLREALQVAVVRENEDRVFGTKEMRAPLLKSDDYGQKFLVAYAVIALSSSELPRVVGDRMQNEATVFRKLLREYSGCGKV